MPAGPKNYCEFIVSWVTKTDHHQSNFSKVHWNRNEYSAYSAHLNLIEPEGVFYFIAVRLNEHISTSEVHAYKRRGCLIKIASPVFTHCMSQHLTT